MSKLLPGDPELPELRVYPLNEMPLAVRDSPPASPGVYLIVDRGRVTYVGQSCCISMRLRAHAKTGYLQDTSEVRWQPEPDIQTRLRLEAVYAMSYLPANNRAFLLRIHGKRLTEIRFGGRRAPKNTRRSPPTG